MKSDKEISRILLDLKDKIESTQRELDQLVGKRELIMEQLKEVFKVSTIPEAEDLLVDLRDSVSSMTPKIEELLKKLKDDYGID
jgi:uncharacterized coiled-coil protein SlyX